MDKAEGLAKSELTIGQLASMSRLTVRALRHYDHIGLLHPVRVDPTNGYRYYDSGQIISASTIAVLRSLDIDVETISHLLDGSRRLGDVLAAERERRERDARRAVASLAVLESLAARHDRLDEPRIVDVPSGELFGISIRVLAADDIDATTAAFTDLFDAAARAQIEFDPDAMCIIRRSTREQLHLDVCIKPSANDGPPPTGYRRIPLEGGPTATLIHHGPLESLPLAHARLNSWIIDTGAEAVGCARETFLGDLAHQQTRVEILVRPTAAPLRQK